MNNVAIVKVFYLQNIAKLGQQNFINMQNYWERVKLYIYVVVLSERNL